MAKFKGPRGYIKEPILFHMRNQLLWTPTHPGRSKKKREKIELSYKLSLLEHLAGKYSKITEKNSKQK